MARVFYSASAENDLLEAWLYVAADSVSTAGGEVLSVDPRNTSRKCPCCGHVSKDNRPSQSLFRCVDCGFENNADVVGAINILRRGMAQLEPEGPDMARIACPASDAARSPATGTHRSDLGEALCFA